MDQVIANILLETTTQDQVVEGRPLNILEKVLIFVPTAAVVDQHFSAYFHVPLAHSCQKALGHLLTVGENPVVEKPHLSIRPVHEEHVEGGSLPIHFEPGVSDSANSFLFCTWCALTYAHRIIESDKTS